MEFEVAEEQAGFRQGKGTQNHLQPTNPNRTSTNTQAAAFLVYH